MTEEHAALADQHDRDDLQRSAVLKKNGQVSRPDTDGTPTTAASRSGTRPCGKGLVAIGAVTRLENLPTTSGLPRYALKPDFAASVQSGPGRPRP